VSMKQTTTATPQERTAQSNGAAYAIAPEIAIDPNQFSTKDLNNFADGVRHLTDNYKPEDLHSLHDSMHEIAPEDLTTGEALITYGIMHNPVMEAIASNHAMDAMAFANDVMINGAQIERLQSRTQMAFASLDADDEDLTPEQRARKRERERAQDTAEALEDIHDEQLKEWQERWDKQMHTVAGLQVSGEQIHSMWKYLQDPANAESFEQELVDKYKISKDEAQKRRKGTQEYLDLLEKQRRGEKLSEADKKRMQELDSKPWMKETIQDLQKRQEKVNEYENTNLSAQSDYKEGSTNIAKIEKSKQFFRVNAESVSKPINSQPSMQTQSAELPHPQSISPSYSNNESFGKHTVQAEPLKGEFIRAGNATNPLDAQSTISNQTKLYAASAALPQMDGATF